MYSIPFYLGFLAADTRSSHLLTLPMRATSGALLVTDALSGAALRGFTQPRVSAHDTAVTGEHDARPPVASMLAPWNEKVPFTRVKMRTPQAPRTRSADVHAMPSHAAWFRVVSPCCGSEPRTNHGQMIKRPVTLSG